MKSIINQDNAMLKKGPLLQRSRKNFLSILHKRYINIIGRTPERLLQSRLWYSFIHEKFNRAILFDMEHELKVKVKNKKNV
jgi:hypothetical protein